MGAEESITHLLSTDPGGALVGEERGEVIGFAQAARREDLWVLCKLFVRPSAQGAGIGRRLLEKAVAYGEGLSAGIICSTGDPRALRSYARLPEFELHPTFTASGPIDRDALARVDHIREGTTADLELAAHVDRAARGAAHGPDLLHLLDHGSSFLVVDDRGYAVVDDAGPHIVAALDSKAAAALLRASLNHCKDGEGLVIPRIGSAHQWALQVALETGLTISPAGALATRNTVAATAAYLPDNVFC
jgi:predicted GNAT family acetyltransferase